jgi:FAD/FMN-containing dehydrogenase
MANTRKSSRKGPLEISPVKAGGFVQKITSPKKSPKTKTKLGAAIDIVDQLNSRFILVYRPGEQEYELSVANANKLFRFSRPTCVVQPHTAKEVQLIVKQAKAQNISITVKCGGHSYIGASSTDNGTLMGLVKMDNAKLDWNTKTMTIGAGAL